MANKPQQKRRTYIDNINAQKKLKFLIMRKIENNTRLSDSEKQDFLELVFNSVQSYGSALTVYETSDGRKINLGNIDEVADIFIGQQGKQAIIKDLKSGKDFMVSYKDLWICFKRTLLRIFPNARQEAFHMSSEAPVKEEMGSFAFDAKTKL